MKADISQLLQDIRRRADCVVLPPSGPVEHRRGKYVMPADLAVFYEQCGGVQLFVESEYSIGVVGPEEVVSANVKLVGNAGLGDISESWFIVAYGTAFGESEQAFSVDFDPGRSGRCYDSFWDRHAVSGSCPIIALSFTELLFELWRSKGGYWFWLQDPSKVYGDAYSY